MRADIHDGPEQPLQSEAGYIDARPQRRQIDEFSCDARPDHTSGSDSALPSALRWRSRAVDPIVRARLEGARDFLAADYIALLRARSALVRAMDARLADLDAVMMPTVPTVAPTIADCQNPDTARDFIQFLPRNTAPVNFFDLCAISLPRRGDRGVHHAEIQEAE
jgi:Asp-tRNA(Asn)/Glu-tRNA(Gln) amidotransferase A subunit family amidase